MLRMAAACAVLAVALGAADAPRDAFGMAVVRRDGTIIPFAAFDGKRWFSTWPQPQSDLTIPITLSAVPKAWWGPTGPLESWQAWTSAGSPTLHVTQPDWVDVHCTRQIGLRTDYRSPLAAPPQTEQPYPKDGLAVSPAQPIERIDILPPHSPLARLLLPVLLESFNRAERIVESRYSHPIGRRSREGVEPTIEAVYAFGTAPRVYYIESTRRYRQLGQTPGECEAFAFGSGWFVSDASGVHERTMTVDLLPCDRQGASYMLPLGAMRRGDRLFWIAQFSGWNHERFVVLEVKPTRIDVAVNVWGGGC